MLKQIHKSRLENHPESDHLIMTNGKVYAELNTVVVELTNLANIKNPVIEKRLTRTALVLAIDTNCDLHKIYGIKRGDTILFDDNMSLDQELEDEGNTMKHPYCFFYSFKTQAMGSIYQKGEFNGPTVLIDQSYVVAKLDENVEYEQRDKKREKIQSVLQNVIQSTIVH